MIIFENVTATLKNENKRKSVVLSGENIRIPSDRCIALLGRSENHRKAIVDLITGMKLPHAGRIIRQARVSFPVGIVPGVERDWSLAMNVAHVARLYGQNEDEIVGFVRRIYERSFNRKYSQLDVNERKRFARILAFAIPFDTYVLPDDRMSQDCIELFEARARTSGMIVNIHNKNFARKYCDAALVVEGGRLDLRNTKALAPEDAPA